MSFNPYKDKQAQEVVFSRKQSKPKHPQLLFNKTPAAYSYSQKHLKIILDEKLSFIDHINVKIQKAGIGINVLPRQALLTIYKAFSRPHLDYGDVIKDQTNNGSLAKQLKVSNIKQPLQ